MADYVDTGRKLNGMEYVFATEYIKNCNIAAAVKKAGYKSSNPSRAGKDLLKKPYIREFISNQLKEIKEAAEKIACKEEVLEILTNVLRGLQNETKFFVVDGELIEKQVPPTITNILKAADTLAKYHGLFNFDSSSEAEKDIELEDGF